MKKSLVAMLILVAVFLGSKTAFAHVVISPKQVGVGAFQTFTLAVPTEKEMSTYEVRLLMPDGLNYVTPNVKPGWSVRVKKEDSANPDKVTEIAWFGGSIPKGFREEFSFNAQVPSEETVLDWKAHQIYVDGSVVSWDVNPADNQAIDASGKPDFSKVGPYSETKVMNDLASTQTSSNYSFSWPLTLSILAIILAVISLIRSGSNRTTLTSTPHTHLPPINS